MDCGYLHLFTNFAPLAQPEEQLLRKQTVDCSIQAGSTKKTAVWRELRF